MQKDTLRRDVWLAVGLIAVLVVVGWVYVLSNRPVDRPRWHRNPHCRKTISISWPVDEAPRVPGVEIELSSQTEGIDSREGCPTYRVSEDIQVPRFAAVSCTIWDS